MHCCLTVGLSCFLVRSVRGFWNKFAEMFSMISWCAEHMFQPNRFKVKVHGQTYSDFVECLPCISLTAEVILKYFGVNVQYDLMYRAHVSTRLGQGHSSRANLFWLFLVQFVSLEWLEQFWNNVTHMFSISWCAEHIFVQGWFMVSVQGQTYSVCFILCVHCISFLAGEF